jgi:2,2-dialkylglycine decarboxylase (pyruvate)
MSSEKKAAAHEAFNECLIRYGGDTYPHLIERAKGTCVWDEHGNRLLDFTSGQLCATVGHNHPALIRGLEEAAKSAIHLFSGMVPTSVVKLAKRLAEILPAPLKKSLFVNTGSESNDAALKMAKMHTGGWEVIAFGGSWHGVTGQAASSSYASDRKRYGPLLPGTYAIPEPNAYRCPIEHCKKSCDMTCMRVGLNMFDMQSNGAPAAVIAEPVISAGGVIVPPPGYFAALKEEAKKRGMLFIFDEAQTAFGRLGAWSASEKLGVTPDIITLSKTFGAGIPLAAVVTSPAIEESCHKKGFAHYTSHVSDPLPAIVGIAVLEAIQAENLLVRCIEKGAYLRQRLAELQTRHEEIGDIRGEGLLYGVELVKDRETREAHHELGGITTTLCLEMGLSMNIRRRKERGAVWRIAPPLTVSTEEIDEAMEIFDKALRRGKDQMAKRRATATAA